MSYTTQMHGYLEVPADEAQAVALLCDTATVSPTSDDLFVEEYAYTTMGEGRMRINISNSELDYSDEQAERFLSLFANHHIQDGSELYFDAEDGNTWRLTKKPEGWVEETGHVIYDDPRVFLPQQDKAKPEKAQPETEMSEEIKQKIADIEKWLWVDRENDGLGYNNSYVNVCLYKEHFTESDKLKFERLIAEKGWLNGAMFAEVRHVSEMDYGVHNEYDVLEFDISKGIASIAAAELSKEFHSEDADVVVAAADDWDQHFFCVYQNGEPLNGCHVHWVDGDEPEPYDEEDEIYYDCFVEVYIPFPFGGYAVFRCGGGMCEKEDFEWYKQQMEANNPPYFAYREYGENGGEQEQDDKEIDR